MSGATQKPDFDTPPVVETALGIQFAALEALSTRDLGQYALDLAQEFPIFEDHPKLARIDESLLQRRGVEIGIGPVTGPQRAFLLSADRASLVQVQSDRFGFNWRATAPDAEYPRYSENAKRCLVEFQRFRDFCGRQSLGQVQPDLCEVVYVNHIDPIEAETAVELFGALFPALRWKHSTDWLPTPATASLNRVYEIPSELGRLYAEASIAHRPNGGDFVLLKMTARVLHASGDPETVGDSLELAHDWVVNGFVSLVDEKIRRSRWRQRT